VVSILEQARSRVVQAVNSEMIIAYWLIGREIVKAIQGGEKRAKYGKQIIKDLSARLKKVTAKGFQQQIYAISGSFIWFIPIGSPRFSIKLVENLIQRKNSTILVEFWTT